jgi:hypothetical protein
MKLGLSKRSKSSSGKSPNSRKKIIKDGARVAAYRADEEAPVVKLLVCDDAGQSKGITAEVGLCWVHDARHYKKLTPVIELHRKLLDEFMDQYWKYYQQLLEYKERERG